jgi:enoyl-CoA hydratase/carnithine racemase
MTTDPQGTPVFETIQYETSADHVATITLNRPDRMNAFNDAMIADFRQVWRIVREDSEVRAVVLRANGDRAFSAGLDVVEGRTRPDSVWDVTDPGQDLAPKANEVWTPVVCAVHGMCAGGAMYWVNESDIVICADDAMFFDPHVTYGMTSVFEPVDMARTVPMREALRMALLGLDERMSATRALEIGLVSEVVPREELWARAHELAAIIADKPAVATQGTVKAFWQSLDMPRAQAHSVGMHFVQIGNPIGTAEVDRASRPRPKWRLR